MSTKTKGCSGHSWGFIAPDVQDPPLCISLCKERFLKELVPGDKTIERACEVLQDRDWMEKEKPFRALYCCDAQACGVDNLGEGGKDHPGPPQPYHICDPESLNDDKDCQQAKGTDKSRDASSQTTSGTSTTERTLPTTLETTSVPIQSSILETTYSTTADPSILATSDPSSSDSSNINKGMPLGVKVTIAIISVVGLLAIAALIFCLVRRRRSRKTDIRRLIKHPSSPPPRADSPTPLVSPTISHTGPDGVPLTPPARLRERRFLANEPNAFPTSPVYSPTSSKLSPRHERTPRIYSASQVPMIVMTAPDGGKVRDDGSLSFSDRVVTPPPSAHIAPLGLDTQTSPQRPPRSRDASFNMLASPGPPPTRALPSTPPYRPSTPTSPPRKGTTPL
ncbi:hypothetical protein FGADI_5616 [Fusarium gaditjirri]|uniref:Uncharacterized protein n=1 Tax=Fusarium gaditjirri TaxID=282569 RepID=A0A8H4WXV2_9HYPO|nr:hypothetical protein FGADI_5616 [Fusarium gaditjirri]